MTHFPPTPQTAIGPHYNLFEHSDSESYHRIWVVGATCTVDGSGRPTGISAVFAGHLAEARAREYAAWMNSQEKASAPFKVGDRIRLKSGGPLMTIDAVAFSYGGHLRCSWEKHPRRDWGYFNPETVTKGPSS